MPSSDMWPGNFTVETLVQEKQGQSYHQAIVKKKLQKMVVII